MSEAWSHVDEKGEARMVDVGDKEVTRRKARAAARISMKETTRAQIVEGKNPKGAVLTVARIAALPNIVGVKEATGELDRVTRLRELAGPDFAIYSGDDATAREAILRGADGDISVTANVAPAAMHAMCTAALAGDAEQAAKLDADLAGLHERLFLEANPIPAKWALQRMGLIGPGIRLPLTPLSREHHDQVLDALRYADVIQEAA